MPPKPQVFKAPDGTEFATRAEWRDYMMATYYSFKNKVNVAEPLIKKPGDIDGQMFDIADCENSTLIIMDNCEQVQIDQVKNCRIFIGACASSIFIRNCENCVFYTCCRQLRLREVTNSTFYIYSMAEVHIEYSNTLQFAPFNGGYPEHARHLANASLDAKQNLWYDIFDHNDPAKTHANWSLLPEDKYEEPWFPAGVCEPAVPRTKAGYFQRPVEETSSMQSFSFQQLVADAQAISIGSNAGASVPPPAPASPAKAAATPATAATPASAATDATTAAAVVPPPAPSSPVKAAASPNPNPNPAEVVNSVLRKALSYEDTEAFSADFACVLADGTSLSFSDMQAVFSAVQSLNIHSTSLTDNNNSDNNNSDNNNNSDCNVATIDFEFTDVVTGEVKRSVATAARGQDGAWKITQIKR